MLGGLLTLLANGPGRPTLGSVRDDWRERHAARILTASPVSPSDPA